MAKQTLALQTAFVATGLLLFAGCSSMPKMEEHPILFPASSAPQPTKKLWTKKVPGLLTDLNLSRDGSTVLVATVPDHDAIDAGANHSEYYAVFYARAGKLLSQTAMPAQIKSQTLSDDGSMAVIATYDDTLRAFDRSGKQLWEAEGFCKPTLLSALKRVLCFHDDDARPELGFELFDLSGRSVGEFPIKDDALVMKVASDEKSSIMALTHGKAIVFDSQFKPVAHKSVSGEIVDVAIASAAPGKPIYAVLYNKKKSSQQKLAFFGPKSFEINVPPHTGQIELSPSGEAVFGYSNSPDGQVLMRLGAKAEQSWKRSEKRTAEFSSQISVTSTTVWMGFQDGSAASSVLHSHVLGFDFAGGLKSNIEVPADEGAFLYTFAVSPAANLIAIGSDDGHLSLFAAAP